MGSKFLVYKKKEISRKVDPVMDIRPFLRTTNFIKGTTKWCGGLTKSNEPDFEIRWEEMKFIFKLMEIQMDSFRLNVQSSLKDFLFCLELQLSREGRRHWRMGR
uniref:Uncharacterized protein n=1 Tax=Cucumis sativus TaxID=3659 RepID=A0A0A0LGL2_CUCSA